MLLHRAAILLVSTALVLFIFALISPDLISLGLGRGLSGCWMSAAVDVTQLSNSHMGIDLCGAKLLVAEQQQLVRFLAKHRASAARKSRPARPAVRSVSR